METLVTKWKRNNAEVTSELRKLTETHTVQGSKLRLLPDSPTDYPGQGVRRVVKGREVTEYQAVAELAEIAEKQFEPMVQKLLEHPDMLNSIGENAKLGNTTTVITSHESDPIDIAVASAATLTALHRSGYDLRLGTVVSKMMAHLGFDFGEPDMPAVIPVVEALRNTGDIYLTFPRTKSIRESTIAEDLVSLYNARMRKQFSRNKHKPNQLFGVAPSGTRAKTIDDHIGTIVVPRVSDTTTSMLAGMVLPIALRTNAPQLQFEILTPRAITDQADMHATMLELCGVSTEMVSDGTQFKYQDEYLEI